MTKSALNLIGARDMVANIAQIHPWILSFLVNRLNQTQNLMGLGKVSFNFQLLIILIPIHLIQRIFTWVLCK